MKRAIALLLCAAVLLGCAHDFERIDATKYQTARMTDAPEAYFLAEEPVDPNDLIEEPTQTILSASNTPRPSDEVEETTNPTDAPVRNSLREQYSIPETVQFDRKEGKLTITGNPVVEVPDVAALPQGTAVAVTFDQQTVDRVYDACYQGRETYDYEYDNLHISSFPHSMIEEMLEAVAEYSDMSKIKSVRYRCEDEMKRIRQFEANATENNSFPKSRPTLKDERTVCTTTQEYRYGEVFGVWNVLGETELAYVYRPASTLDFMACRQGQFVCDATKESQVHGLKPTKSTMATAPSEAVRSVRAFLERAGMEAFTVFQVSLMADTRSNAQWYLISCKRTVEGVPVSVATDSMVIRAYQPSDMENNGAARLTERLAFVVSDTGIRRIHWENPISVTVKAEQTELIPFSEVVALGTALLYDAGKNTTIRRTLTVERLSLSICVIVDPNEAGKGTLAPVWGISYSTAMDGNEQAQTPIRTLFIRADTGEVLDSDFDAGTSLALPSNIAVFTHIPTR